MRRMVGWAAAVLLIFVLPLQALAAELVPVGKVIGIQVRDGSVTVAAFDEKIGSSAMEAGLKIGDVLLKINGVTVTSAEEVTQLLGSGEAARITLRRGSRQRVVTVPLTATDQGSRLGVYLRQGITGIGTVTWYDPETGRFGALGHGVSDGSGNLLQMTGGDVCDAWVEAVRRGSPGQPGQLRGSRQGTGFRGSLERNTSQGIFGTAGIPWEGQTRQTAEFDQIQSGPATILATVEGDSPREYSVEILKIYSQDRPDGRNFLLKVTDPNLLKITGGIVQGMSGSPLLQNGKIIGAVTHVLVNDPTMGYGIYIGNMLDAAA